jgi:uncharacterized protein YkwD
MKPEDSSKKVLIILLAILFSCLTFYFANPKLIDQDKYRNLFHRLEVYQEFGKTENNNKNKKPSHKPGNNSSSQPNNQNPMDSSDGENNNQTPSLNEKPNHPTDSNVPDDKEYPNESFEKDPIEKPSIPPEIEPDPPIIDEKPTITPSGETTYTIGFYQNGATSIETKELKCTTKNKSCYITLPQITRNDGTVYGWSQNAHDKNGIPVNTAYEVTNNHYLYAITSKTNQIKFEPNGATLNSTSASCTMYNQEQNCQVKTPKITRTGGYALGFSPNKSATSSTYQNTITTAKNMTVYAISYSEYNAHFNPNGAFHIGATSLSCKAYNQNSSCSIIAPTIEKDSYTTIGWSPSSEASSVTYQVGSTITLNKNINLHGIRRVNNSGFLTQEAYNGLSLVNNLRLNNGVPSLRWSKSLEYSAELRVQELIDSGYNPSYPHNRPDGREFYTVNDLAYGESWTDARTGTADEMYQNFFISPPHKNAMLNREYTIIGIAGKKSPKDGKYYWVQLFGN